MYVLGIDDEKLALNSLLRELKIVFPKENIHTEQSSLSAIKWAKELSLKGEILSYAFLDIKMAGMSGLELAKELKIIFPYVTLFFCSAYRECAIDEYGSFEKGYLKKPVVASEIAKVIDEMETDWKKEASKRGNDVIIKTFGKFEVFVKNEPVIFETEKAKELLAFLVYKNGLSVKNKDIANVLWKEKEYNSKGHKMLSDTISALKRTLKEYNIKNILSKSWWYLAVDTSKFSCDAYNFKNFDTVAINSFKGEYMVDYLWAEFKTESIFN